MTPAAPSAGDAGGSSGAGRGRRGGDADASGGAAGREGRAAGAADQDESRDAGRVSHGSEPATERDGGIDGQAAAGDAPDTEADGAGPCDPGSEAEVEMRAALAEVAVLFALRDALADAAPRRAALASEVQRYLGADPRPALESLRDRGLVEHIEAADLWRPVKGVA
ncbi:hypothetical protein CKO13_01430 [Halorhodospira neutriphila]|uniref:Uncharacterized protein n=2 Tax=Halorhodospira neutriphila TaxID=168379 RepID=A0ABS1E3A5_9GAMM|nr:hypothetical protein [Halorhodospira neutriphila]